MLEVLLLVLGVCLLFQIVVQCYVYVGLSQIRKNKLAQSGYPALSVIIALKNEEDHLSALIDGLKGQDYPNFEVLLLDDGSTDRTFDRLLEAVDGLERFKVLQVGQSDNGLSQKKAALAFGIERARHENLVFTDADCVPSDDQWLSRIGEAYANGADVVIGHGAYRVNASMLSRIYGEETNRVSMIYHAAASNGHPYMCVGRSMAYTKSAFHNAGGFDRYAHIPTGSDDLLLQSFQDDTRIVSVPNALTISDPPDSFGAWIQQKSRHLGASPHYSLVVRGLLFMNEFSISLLPLLLFIAIIRTPLVSLPFIAMLALRQIMAWNNQQIFTRLSGETRSHQQVWWMEYLASWTNALLSISSLWVKSKGWKSDPQGQAPSAISGG